MSITYLRSVRKQVNAPYELFLRPIGSIERRIITLDRGDDLLVLRPRNLVRFYRRLEPADDGMYASVRLRRVRFAPIRVDTPDGEKTDLFIAFSEWRDPLEQILERFGDVIPSLKGVRWEELGIRHRLPWRLRFRAV